MENTVKVPVDTRICDREQGAQNKKTYREFIQWASMELYGEEYDDEELSKKSFEEIDEIIEELDWMLGK